MAKKSNFFLTKILIWIFSEDESSSDEGQNVEYYQILLLKRILPLTLPEFPKHLLRREASAGNSTDICTFLIK